MHVINNTQHKQFNICSHLFNSKRAVIIIRNAIIGSFDLRPRILGDGETRNAPVEEDAFVGEQRILYSSHLHDRIETLTITKPTSFALLDRSH